MTRGQESRPVRVQVRLTEAEDEAFSRAAKALGLSLSAWIRSTCRKKLAGEQTLQVLGPDEQRIREILQEQRGKP